MQFHRKYGRNVKLLNLPCHGIGPFLPTRLITLSQVYLIEVEPLTSSKVRPTPYHLDSLHDHFGPFEIRTPEKQIIKHKLSDWRFVVESGTSISAIDSRLQKYNLQHFEFDKPNCNHPNLSYDTYTIQTIWKLISTGHLKSSQTLQILCQIQASNSMPRSAFKFQFARLSDKLDLRGVNMQYSR